MPKLMISSSSIFCDVYVWNENEEEIPAENVQTAPYVQTEPYKAGVCRLLSTRMALGFQSPKNLSIEPKNFLQSLRSVVNEEILMLIFDTHDYAVAFFCSYEKRCKFFESCCFIFLISSSMFFTR